MASGRVISKRAPNARLEISSCLERNWSRTVPEKSLDFSGRTEELISAAQSTRLHEGDAAQSCRCGSFGTRARRHEFGRRDWLRTDHNHSVGWTRIEFGIQEP